MADVQGARREANRGGGDADYRTLFSLDEATTNLLIVRIAHRADVYHR